MRASFEVIVMNLLNWMGHHYNYSVTMYCINVTSIIHKLLISLVAQSEKKDGNCYLLFMNGYKG